MKLICEVTEDVKYLFEEKKGGAKNYFIEGIFMQGDIKNRNGRVYPSEVLARESKRYTKEYINKKRAYGELGHPQGPTINLERVSHLITELKQDGSNFIGKAKIMCETPYGKIVKSLMDEGAQLGVSSRGMGSLKEKGGKSEVQNDFYLATAADIVADPSAPGAFVSGIMEGKEWIWDNGIIKESDIAAYAQTVSKASKKNLETAKLKVFENFLSKL
jgi:hypothetical protein|tara:strand:- start:127 stop:777 length:651 start_codon:yes stop_codon:yes gene_type:complete